MDDLSLLLVTLTLAAMISLAVVIWGRQPGALP
jgi:hypothetical protein